MSDPLREAIRSAIAEMREEAPEPPTYAPAGSTAPAQAPWRGPALAIAAFVALLVVIGFAALLIAPDEATPPATELDAPPVTDETGLLIPSYLPPGLELAGARRSPGNLESPSHLWYLPAGDADITAEDQSMFIDLVRPFGPMDVTSEQMLVKLEAANPGDLVSTLAVNGGSGFLVSGAGRGGADLLMVLDTGHILEISAAGFGGEELLRVAESLVPVSEDGFLAYAAERIPWDLHLQTRTDRPDETRSGIADLEGVASVRMAAFPRSDTDALRDQLLADDTGVVETTVAASGEGTAPTPPPGGPIGLFVVLDDGVDPEEVAGEVSDLGPEIGIELSPALARKRADAFLSWVREEGIVLDAARPIYQAPPGPPPEFGTDGLGTETPLTPATDEGDVAGRHSPTFGEPPEGPTVSIGFLSPSQHLALVFYDEITYEESMTDAGGRSASGGDFGSYHYGVAMASWGGPGGSGTVVVRVPSETSVIQFVTADGAIFWQRAIAGYGAFEVEGPFGDDGPQGEVVAYAADGTILGRWSTDR